MDGEFFSNLRFVDNVVLSLNSTAEEDAMLIAELNEAGKRENGKIEMNRRKIQFINNAYCEVETSQLEGSQLTETSFYVYSVVK